MLEESIERLDHQLVRQTRENETARRLTSIPGIGAISVAALQRLVPDPQGFASARHFAAWLGLTPRLNSSGGKERLGWISKQGNPMLRQLLVLGATACLRHARRDPEGPPGQNGCSHAVPSRSLPLRSPTRRHGLPGLCL